jgi:DNA-directed RNA polymerase beta' subunit
MKLDLVNMESFVTERGLKQITSANVSNYQDAEPAKDGLASYEIFGRPGSEERKRTFAYIDLYDHFLHPHCYYELTRLHYNFKKLVDGEADFYVKDGSLVEIKKGEIIPPEIKKGTGLQFFYEIYNDLKWDTNAETASQTALRRKFFAGLHRDDVFISKMLVIPPFFRDVDTQKSRPNEINVFYSKVLSNASAIKTTAGLFDIFGFSSAHKKVQDTINEIYNFFMSIIGGTKGYIHKNIMGKTTDYSARCVVAMPRYDIETSEESEVSFGRSAVPLSVAVKCFAPFIKYGVRRIVEGYLSGNKFIYVKNKKGVIERCAIAANAMDVISPTNMDRLIELYDKSPAHRLDDFKIKLEDGRSVPFLYYYIDPEESKKHSLIVKNDPNVEDLIMDKSIKAINYTELFYMAAYNTVKDYAIYITRFPIENQHNIYPSQMNIIPCTQTKKRIVNGVEYPRFPVYNKSNMDLKHYFVDTLRMFPSYLAALNADFDGDMTSIQGCYTNEANAAAQKYIYSKMNILDTNGGSMRTIPEVAQSGLFHLTYRYPKP